MPRPSKFTDDVKTRLIEAARLGLKRDLMAKYAGISPATLYSFLKKGAEGKDGYVEFLEDFLAAEGIGAFQMMKLIRKAALKDWKAAAWIMQCRWGYHKNSEPDPSILAPKKINVSEILKEIDQLNQELSTLTGPRISDDDL